ncbi:uncharacterized protein LOC108912853 isoform X2 [Anoplophora glabripennis]|uniref:uncharacterized protein LOC108912853 isoform X2 n=1 Tax=Anoplophora glabripennis TaxID=217634 RepID=UPI0008739BE9|nr:uncharacterized protein LOC108912853 isoform X2 [Anoplophora glabripennis]
MKCLQILLLFCTLFVLAAAEKTDDHKASHHSQEKSHQNKHRHEKSHISDRHKKTETRIHSSSHFKHLAYRDGNQQCHVVCNGSPSNGSDLQVLYNADAGLIAYLNQTAHVALLEDYFNNITLISNGQSGNAIVENIAKDKYYSIEKNAQTEEALWLSSKTDFNAFFKNLTSLQKFLKLGEEHGKSINKGEDLIKAETPDLKLLSFKTVEGNVTSFVDFRVELNRTLRFIFKGQGSFTVHKNIVWFTNVNLAFADLFRDCQGQLQSGDFKLNLTRIYDVNSGVEALVNLLSQLGTRVNLANLLRNQLSSPEKLLEILAKLSGGSNEGIDGIVTVVTTVIRATNGHASINDVISAILNYETDGDSTSLTKVVDEALELIESQNRAYNNSEAFQGIVTVLKAINNHNLVFRNINISDILTLLISRNPVTIIQTVVRIFIRFGSSEGFQQVIRDFIQGLNGTDGLNIISRIFPGANLDSIRHSISSALSSIPVIGHLFRNVSSVGEAFNTSSSFISGIPVIGRPLANAASGIASGIENIFGPQHQRPAFGPPFRPPYRPDILNDQVNATAASVTESSNHSSGNGVTEKPNASSTNASTSANRTETETNSPTKSGTEGPNTGNSGTKPPSSPEGTTADTSTSKKGSEAPNPSSGSAATESPKSGSTDAPASGASSSPAYSAGSTTAAPSSTPSGTSKAPGSRKGKNHELHEKDHHHHHTSNKKENVHTRQKHEKEHHENLKYSNRKENLHQKHRLEEKEHHHGHLQGPNKYENVQQRYKQHEKHAQEKIHGKAVHEKKHDDHHNHH